MASPAAVLQILVTANTAAATAGLARTDAQLKKTTATANTASTAMGTRMASAAKMGSAAVGVGLVYALGKAVKVGADFEKQMDAVGSVADANTKQMKRLEKQALSLGQKTQYSAMEVAAAQEELVKGGLKVKDVIGGALPAALSLAAAGELELADASATTVNAMKLFGLQAKDASSIADMLATAANKTTGDVEDFSVALKQGGAVAKLAGLNLNQTVVALEALAESGVKNSDAGTSMKTAFIQLLKPTEKQKDLAEELNLSFVNQAGNMKNMAALSADLIDATDGMTNAQRAATFATLAGTDGVRTLNALYAAGPDALRKYADANRENGTANEIAREKMDNLSGSLEQLGGAFQTLAIKVSKVINPVLREAVDWLTDAVTDLGNMDLSNLSKNDSDLAKFGEAMHNLGVAVKVSWNSYIKPVLEVMGPALKTWAKGILTGVRGLIEIIAGVLTLDLKMALGGLVDVVKGFSGALIGAVAYFTAPVRTAFAKLGGIIVKAFKAPVMGVVKVVGFVFDKVMGTFSSFLRVAAAAADKLSGIPLIGDKFDGLAEAATGAADRIDGFRDSLKGDDNAIKKEAESLQDLAKVFKDLGGDVADVAAKVNDKVGDMVKGWDKLTDKTKGMGQKVGGTITDLARTVTGGLSTIAENTNKALQGYGVKKISFSFKQVGAAAKGFQTGGVIVPGQGDGDKIPAMLEPGEVVWNKKAVAAMGGASKANSINSKIPRFAKGGTVGGATGGLHPSILQFVSQLYQKYGGSVTSGVRAGDSGSLHSTGQAADYVPANWPGAAAAANRAGSSLLEGIYNPGVYGGPAVSWDSGQQVSPGYWGSSTWGGHLDHIHLAVADGTKAAIGDTIDSVKRILLKGPKGPLRDMGQSALDKVRDAANKYIQSKLPTIGMGPMHGPIKGLPDALQKYNRQYAEAPAPSHLTAPKMPFNAVAATAEWAGMPGVSMARTAIGESALAPGASGIDPGGTKGLGLWMVTTGFNDALIKQYGGQDSMFNPILNAQAANSIFDSQGYGAWYSQTKDTSNTHYNGPLLRQIGGIIPGFAKGGGAKKGGKFFDLIEKIQTRIKRIAKIDERYGLAEREAGANWSPAGSDYDQDEVNRLVGLKKRALGNMLDERGFVELAQKLSGKKVKHLKHRITSSPLAQEIAKHHRKVKNLREDLGDVGHGQLGVLRDRLKNAGTKKEKEAIQKLIDKVTKENSKKIETIQHQIDKEQKVIGDLREKQQDRKAHLNKRINKFTNRDDWLAEQLEGLQGLTGKGGSIAETRFDIKQLRGSVAQPDKSAQIADLTALLNQANARYAVSQAQYGVFDGFRAKGGKIGAGKWAIAGERGPEPVMGPATVLPNSSFGGAPSLTIEELNVYADGRVGMKVGGKEFEAAVMKVNRKQARSGGRVLPGRAGS